MDDEQKQVMFKIFSQRENSTKHSPYEKEFEYYECVKEGNIKRLSEIITDLGGEGTGKLSADALQNIKYHFVISVALVTRYCVEGGLEMETAYNMSDYYINKGDLCSSIEEVNALNRVMVKNFASKMSAHAVQKVYSRQATICMDYIFNNLHSRLTVESVADVLNLSAGYLSRMFHKEVGITVSGYIIEKRIQAAENLLKYSDYSSLDIANYLCFSSHSHFISVFKEHTGMTPGQYRNKYYRNDWTSSEHKSDG